MAAKQTMPFPFFSIQRCRFSVSLPAFATRADRSTAAAGNGSNDNNTYKKKPKIEKREVGAAAAAAIKKNKEKRRTRSDKQYDLLDNFNQFNFLSTQNHFPVLLGEVLDVFSSLSLRSFVDCTLGTAGHSSAVIQAHPELEYYVGMDVDPVAHAKARAQIDNFLHSPTHSSLKVNTFLKNFRELKGVLSGVDRSLVSSGVDAILMDLGISSMQVNDPERGFSILADGPLDMRMDPRASLKADDILNSWPDAEVGRILREYGEESNWHLLQKKIVRARQNGGLHTTTELADLIRSMTGVTRGGRQGWIKTATRVFQALRIAVNDELGTLEKSLHTCFECLAPGGRLAVISFHSLEDRVVKQTFLNIINGGRRGGDGEDGDGREIKKTRNDSGGNKEAWVKQTVHGPNGTILTKRPITPSEEEESLNRRCRSAKLRVIEKF